MMVEKKNDKTNYADANRESFVTKGASARAHIRLGGSASSEMY